MTPLKRSIAAATAALFVFSLSACGDSDKDSDKDNGNDSGSSAEEREAPAADASEEDFCAAVNDESLADVDEEDFDAQAEALHDYADALEEVGTPESIPDDARNGYEVLLEAYGEIEADDLEDEDAQEELEEKYKDDEDDIEAFFTYAGETCVPDIAPTDGSTDAPTE